MAAQRREQEQAIESVSVVWQYRSADDTKWKDMPNFYSELYEANYQNSIVSFEYDVQYAGGTKNYHYNVDLENMMQKNENTSTQRRIRRTTIVTIADS